MEQAGEEKELKKKKGETVKKEEGEDEE
jgi:hypothetical protein